jgi:prepilin peptidase CpaA
MTTLNLLMLAPLLAALVLSAVIDHGTRRIPNWLSFSLLAAGLAQSFFAGSYVTPGWSLLGCLAGFGLMFPFFVIGAKGGGDLKLMTAVGAWVGPMGVLAILVIETVIGAVYAMGISAANGRLRMLFRNSAVVAINLAHIREVGVEHALDAEKRYRVGDRPLPYAVPVLVATILVLGLKWRGGLL